MNFNAMVDYLYKRIDSEGSKNVYTSKPAICFLEKKSFVNRIHIEGALFQIKMTSYQIRNDPKQRDIIWFFL